MDCIILCHISFHEKTTKGRKKLVKINPPQNFQLAAQDTVCTGGLATIYFWTIMGDTRDGNYNQSSSNKLTLPVLFLLLSLIAVCVTYRCLVALQWHEALSSPSDGVTYSAWAVEPHNTQFLVSNSATK